MTENTTSIIDLVSDHTPFLTSDNSPLSEPKKGIQPDLHGPPMAPSGTVRGYVREAIAENTRRAYRSDIEHFMAWGGTIPAADVMVAEYLANHAERLAVATLSRRLVSISQAHAARGLRSPASSSLVSNTMRGIKRIHGAPQRAVRPLLVQDLIHIMAALGNRPKDVRDRALLLLGFAGGFRRSELVALDMKDIQHVRQGQIVTIGRSKTDQEGKGREIGIPFARGQHCPVRSLEAWCDIAAIETGPLFCPISRHGHIADTRLSGEAVATIIKQRAKQAGLDADGYSGHSLRAGLATSAAMAGISTLAIRRQTGHRSDAMLARYVRSGELFTDNAVSTLL